MQETLGFQAILGSASAAQQPPMAGQHFLLLPTQAAAALLFLTLSMPTAWEPWPGNRKAIGPEGAALGLAGAAAAAACEGRQDCTAVGLGRAWQAIKAS